MPEDKFGQTRLLQGHRTHQQRFILGRNSQRHPAVVFDKNLGHVQAPLRLYVLKPYKSFPALSRIKGPKPDGRRSKRLRRTPGSRFKIFLLILEILLPKTALSANG
jgi:hypothetical protein